MNFVFIQISINWRGWRANWNGNAL